MDSNASQEAQLVEAHALALKELRTARRVAILVPFALLLMLLAALGIKVGNFAKNDAPKIPQKLVEKAPAYLDEAAGLSLEALGRLTPIYQKAIAQAFERDKEIYRKLVESQTSELLKYAAGMQVQLRERFDGLMKSVLASVEDKLAAGMSVEEKREFEALVAMRLYDLLRAEVETNWARHVEKIENVCTQMYALSLGTDEAKNMEPRQIIGVGLELLGLYLQEKELKL